MNETSEEERQINTSLQIFLYSATGLISLLSNLLIILVISTKKRMRTLNHFLLVNLAISDLFISLFGLPPTIANLVRGTSNTEGVMCVGLGLMLFMSFVVSVFNLVLIAIHRYVLIAKNNRYQTIFNGKTIFIAISTPWLLSLSIGIPPLVGWGRYNYSFWRAHCMTDWGYSLSYVIFIQLLAYPIPLSLLVYCYFKVLSFTSQSRKRLTTSVDRANLARRQREHQLTKMLIAIVVCFFICFTPYAVLVQMEGIFQRKANELHSLIAMLFAYSNSIFDFWIYSVLSTQFRKALKVLIKRKTRQIAVTHSKISEQEEQKARATSADEENNTLKISNKRLSAMQNSDHKDFFITDTEFRL